MAQSDQQMLTTRKSLIGWYRDQLAKFHKLGIGKFTENNTKVSQTLIDTTEKRIVQLGGVDALHPDWGIIKIEPLDDNSTKRVTLFRERQLVKQKLREMMDDSHTNGTASHTRGKGISNNGHEGDQS
jgi:hypothetical protein